MMMKMLDAGGIPPLTDQLRTADEDNPKGYYEWERAKDLATDTAWLADAQGKAVKVISLLLKHLPPTYSYRVLFMERPLAEVLASQRAMLVRRGEPTDRVDNGGLEDIYTKHLADIRAWIAATSCVKAHMIPYHDVLSHPETAAHDIADFLDNDLDIEAMCAVVDPQLYRQKSK